MAIALDPVHLPLSRATRTYKETRQDGLFGVIRDASPEGYGLSLLESIKGINLSDPLLHLEVSEGDAVGAIEICDDIAAKQSYSPPGFDIAPYITYSGNQSMALTRDGKRLGTRQHLLQDCKSFGWQVDEASEFIDFARRTLLSSWPDVVSACGIDPHELPAKDPADWLIRG